MVTRQRIWIAAGVAAAVLAVVLVLALTGGTRSVEVPQQAVTGQTNLSRSGTLFADPLRASVQVLVDRQRVDPSRIGFTTRFDPYVRVGDARVTRRDTGPVTQLVYSAELICLTNACLAKHSGESVRVQFPPAEVFYVPKSGGRRTLQLSWQALTVGGRTSEVDLAGADPFLQPSWRATTDPVAVTYGTSPRLLRGLLFGAAGLLFTAGLGGCGSASSARSSVRSRSSSVRRATPRRSARRSSCSRSSSHTAASPSWRSSRASLPGASRRRCRP